MKKRLVEKGVPLDTPPRNTGGGRWKGVGLYGRYRRLRVLAEKGRNFATGDVGNCRKTVGKVSPRNTLRK